MLKKDEQTLLEWLQERFPESSKTTLRQMLQRDRVFVNGNAERNAKRMVSPGDRVEVAGKKAKLDPRLRVLFEDEDLIVIEKPAGLLAVPSDQGRFENAEELLDAYLGGKPGVKRVHHVHRLDRDTSGVLVFAKNAFARDRLKESFAKHDIKRLYIAIVKGKMPKTSGTMRNFLAEGADLRVRVVADASQGKEAITHYHVVASGEHFSMLELTLETGRRNQIRVQLAERDNPVLGDAMYYKGGANPLGRLALHAKVLGFLHPRSGKRIQFATQPPREFLELKL